MAKFGEIINVEIPVLICFYGNWTERHNHAETLNDIVSVLKNKTKVIKISVEKNPVLASALSVKENPTFVIYKKGQMKWRGTGNQNTTVLIHLIKQYV